MKGTGLTDRSITTPSELDALRFDEAGLIPVVAQDADDGGVLMVAWANREALERTLDSGEVHFWSRSREALWRKGETSGHTLALVSLHADCDRDTLLARVRPSGPACHTGEPTCFGEGASPGETTRPLSEAGTLTALWTTLVARAADRPEGSWTVKLLDDPNLRIKKLGEETAEVIHALVSDDGRAPEEAADLLYHLLVALLASGHTLDDLLAELESRR
ncbi:MAG: bifunctional phosphoribosyl-AMP cyclohydrolase/phosphoribosyl-ATP diphosphatase HisIE [Longimicrobiales bacterium]|nr:bifunctional phosphoribosyl-AMP cyclohydrolase/phosphoribosyl-ATP diphosphatase HisIE [Longimicrobiales bacterium]